jgi:hypothetical protein
MSYRDWHVGMRVVCVEPDMPDDPDPSPRCGGVYTISNIYACPEDGEIMVELHELPSPETEDWWAGWRAKDFRPVQRRKTDISIFNAMLHDKKERVDA